MFVPLFAEYGEDIYYGSNSNSNRLDVYIPDTSKYPQIFDAAFHPVIVFIHGGSWGSGDKIWYSLLALRLRQMGYVVVVPNVTLYPKAKVDVMLSDIKRTLVWTKRFISKFGGDPNKIYIMGHSSGAHLASLVTVRDSIIKSQTMEGRVSSNLSDIDPELELPKIAGLILMAGIYDIGRHYLWETKRGVEEISPMGRVMEHDQGGIDFTGHEGGLNIPICNAGSKNIDSLATIATGDTTHMTCKIGGRPGHVLRRTMHWDSGINPKIKKRNEKCPRYGDSFCKYPGPPVSSLQCDSPESFEMNSPTLLLQSAMKDREDETVPLETTLRFNLVLSELNIDDLRLRIMNGMEHSDPVVGM
ncbi:18353_t:CDS:10, partial [Gigaspora rosea]